MLVTDVETAYDPAALPLLPAVEAAGNLKDPGKILASIAERAEKQHETMPLIPAYCRIVAIGYTLPDDSILVDLCKGEASEREALFACWRRWAVVGQRPVFFNAAFDIPVLVTRSIVLGVPYPRISVRKYGSPDYDDLMLDLSFGETVDYKSLAFWCARLKLDVPEDASTGKDVAGFVAAGDWDAVEAHCRADVAKTLALAYYLGVGR